MTGEAIAKAGLDIKDCRGQGYDRASNTSSEDLTGTGAYQSAV